MVLTIRVDQEVYRELQAHAEAFVDSPNDVLRRLLGLDTKPGASAPPTTRRPKYPVGAVTRRPQFRAPILRALVALGGRGAASDVLAGVEADNELPLTPLDKQLLPTGDLRWRKQANFERWRMVRDGLLKDDSPRGFWELTPRGWEQARLVS